MIGRAAAAVVAVGLTACGADPLSDASGTGGNTGTGSVVGSGGSVGTTAAGGGAGDLGWPFDTALPDRCPAQGNDSGRSWQGWANVQHPSTTTAFAGETSEPIYGRAYAAGETMLPGQASGWEAELAVGPLGSLPTGEGRCWSFLPAAFHLDVGNDDEYVASVATAAPGLHGLFYRVRPPGGAWRYGDKNGSDDGITAAESGVLQVSGAVDDGAPFVVVTLNLRCRFDDWAARKPLVVAALARHDPDLIAFQEDCIDDGRAQAEEVREALSAFTRRGYDVRRATTHQANVGGASYDEGVSLLSAHPITATEVLDLPYAQLPRKAIGVDVTARGRSLRFYATHLDFGDAAEGERNDAAKAILADLPAGTPGIVAGDLNADPAEPAIATLAGSLHDAWAHANPSDAGLTFPAAQPTTRIDYAFASPELTAGLLGATRIDESEGGTLLSDHLGVAIALALP